MRRRAVRGLSANYSTKQKGRRELAKSATTMVREAGLEPARPEWTLEPESHYGRSPSVGAGLAAANPLPLCKSPHCYYLLTQTLA